MASRRRQSEHGFTLIEMSIVIVIIGIILSMSMSVLTRQVQRTALVSTKDNADQVIDAVANFLYQHNRLPCPAAPNGSGASFGQERNSCTNVANAGGIVPFKTLGLTEAQAKDGYKRYLTYRVTPALASSSFTALTDYCAVSDSARSSDIDIRDENNNSVSPGSVIAVAIISHGENGYGAYTGNGNNQYSATAGSNDEDENADEDENLVDRPFSSNSSDIFDDLVRWKTKYNLVSSHSSSFSCPPASP